ncbi:inositol monophosphatase family protein [Paenibacillus sp. HB172176]|uniref:inositol monophosphatase family protein n=1 Tax=Paenibacillus sp. HB172176 TaxID=2493690 RepID=UPI00143BCBD8|nr:inositol monophosphatase family protein [Paenibacillus sp. HB172176]
MRLIQEINEVRSFLNQICELVDSNMLKINEMRYQIFIKEDQTPVTKSDLFVEKLIFDFVKERLPGATFVGEESFDSSVIDSSGYLVILDPIDGTENFCSGLKEWGVSFSLWQGSIHLGSFLYMPELHLKLMTGDSIECIHSRITGISSSMDESLIDILRGGEEYRIMGCAVYNIYNVIRGSYKRFVNPKGAYIWDVLPGIMLALEHGCSVTMNGEAYHGHSIDPTIKYCIDIRR